MQALVHPFFEALYIDPAEGLYWKGTAPFKALTVPVVLFIPDPKKVTPPHIEFATSCIADLEGLDILAKTALANNYIHNEFGVAREYYGRFLTPFATFPAPQPHIDASAFTQQLYLTFLGIYPTHPQIPILLEYKPQHALYSPALSLAITALPEITDIFIEEPILE